MPLHALSKAPLLKKGFIRHTYTQGEIGEFVQVQSLDNLILLAVRRLVTLKAIRTRPF